jgi:hypothetical protein
MPRITVQAIHADGAPRRWTLSERIVAENLDSDHYVTQLIERLSWATADAEALESQSGDLTAEDIARHDQLTIRSRGDSAARPLSPRPIAGNRRVRT